jgi:hypothetical protein
MSCTAYISCISAYFVCQNDSIEASLFSVFDLNVGNGEENFPSFAFSLAHLLDTAELKGFCEEL